MMESAPSHAFVLLSLFQLSTVVFSSAPSSRAGYLPNGAVNVTVNLQQSLSSIGSHFVGVTIDMAEVRYNWSTLDFGSQKVQSLARELSPLYFRLGGYPSDQMVYDLGDHAPSHRPPLPEGWFSMSAKQWDVVNQFTQKVGWDLVFDFNALTRNSDGSWNPENARQLLNYSAARNFSIAGFQIGNEYNNYPRAFNTTLRPAQYVLDHAAMLSLLREFPYYRSAFAIGPDTIGSFDDCFQGYYYFGAPKAVQADFTDVKVMDGLVRDLDQIMSKSHSVEPRLPVWLTETSATNERGVGTPNMSDRFLAGFLWLDKLGLSASRGVESVLRQVFFGTNDSNALINDKDLNPNPDWWLTVLYKRLVRGNVFSTTGRDDVRVYSACANTHSGFRAGSVVIYMLNPNHYPVAFDLIQFESQQRLVYSLTAGDDDGLLSRFVSLNGVQLQLVNDELPPLSPVSAPPGVLTTQPYSFTFVVLTDAAVSICQNAEE